MGTLPLFGCRRAFGLAAAKGGAACRAEGAGGEDVGAPDHRDSGVLWGLDDRALVLHGAQGRVGSAAALSVCRATTRDMETKYKVFFIFNPEVGSQNIQWGHFR